MVKAKSTAGNDDQLVAKITERSRVPLFVKPPFRPKPQDKKLPHKVIFDTDPGVDDAIALLLLHRHAAVDLIGITTVFGNGDIATVTRNALYLKARFGISAPVAAGAERALCGRRSKPPVHIHGENGLGDVELGEFKTANLDPTTAPQFIIDTIRRHPGEVTLLAVGRMTNLAMAAILAPDIVPLVKQVVIMGGAFGFSGHNGNVTPVGEANIIGDPEAADIVFTTPWPVVAIGLDVTRQVVATAADMDELGRSNSDAAQFVAAISEGYMRHYLGIGAEGLFVHDATAAAYVIAPELFTLRKGPVRVVTSGLALGQTIQRDEGSSYRPGDWDNVPNQCACESVNSEAVRRMLIECLVAKP